MNVTENTVRVEVLQPEISNQIQQTTLEDLKNWIKSGKLQPTHKVRIRNLTWIEAQKIPVFQALFEAKKINPKPQSDFLHNQSSAKTQISKTFKSDFNEKPISAKKPLSTTVETSDKNNAKVVEPSVPFKLFAEKARAKSLSVKPLAMVEKSPETGSSKAKSVKPIAKPHSTSPALQKEKASLVKRTASFLAGCVLMFLFAFGGSYLWVYQLKTAVAVENKSLPELSKLEDKLTSDKFELRLKDAANKQTAENNGNLQQTDVAQEIAKLDKQFDSQRKIIIEKYRNDLAKNNFINTFYFSFAVLLVLFLLLRIFYTKTAQPVEDSHSSKSPDLQNLAALNVPTNVIQKENFENSPKLSAIDSSEVHVTNSTDAHAAKFSDKTETVAKTLDTPKVSKPTETPKSVNCLLHRDKPAQFVCEDCANNFCAECPKIFDQIENGCPFCKVACKSMEANLDQTPNTQSATELKKSTNLLDATIKTDFVVYDFPENKTRKIGIIPAFLIALLFSASISIFWVYKISPYLENRQLALAQNVSVNQTQPTGKDSQTKINAPTDSNNSGNASAPKNGEAEANNAADKMCIDPQTEQPFECDEQTRSVLYEHTRKTESVKKAQKEVSEKTNLILGLVSSSAREELEKTPQEIPKPNAAEEARNASDRQQLIKVFLCSFLTIFSLILSTRLFSKNRNEK